MPCFNEEDGIEIILKTKPDFIDEVIVIDNNSTDKTSEIAKNLGARVIFEKKRGYGQAYLTGFRHAIGDIIVTMDGDNSYPIKEVNNLLDNLLDKNLDFISGCRFPLKNKRSMGFLNRLGNFALTLFFNILVFKNIKDSQSGMWVFRREVLSKMRLRSGSMSFSEEIKMEAILSKEINFEEKLITYSDRMGRVKLERWSDGFRNLLFLFKKRLDIFINNK